MTKIRVLPEILANKIAAGEIVERPASALKELVENSIDAQSKTIEVEVTAGGKQSMRVKDDGEGMSHDDAILAFEHHATSKIASAEDLMAIHTLGFRGEALPSIASVSRLTLKTMAQGDSAGAEIEINGGVIRKVKEVAWEKGTEIRVQDLFFNMPARRKFLKSTETELGHITRLITQYALAYPGIAFTLLHQQRELLRCSPVESLRERIYQLHGEDFLSNLVEFKGVDRNVNVYGFASQPHEQRTNPYAQFFFVNKRMVRDRVISHAVTQAYKAVLPSSLYPVILLFIEIPAEEIDVNVHPSKLEIRFRQSDLVHELIKNAIQSGLLRAKAFPDYVSKVGRGVATVTQSENETFKLQIPELKESAQSQSAFRFSFQPKASHAQVYPRDESQTPPAAPMIPLVEKRSDEGVLSPHAGIHAPCEKPQYQISEALSKGGARAIGQLHESFILAADAQGLLIVDQHVAHERILYEQTLAQMQSKALPVQHLLVPQTLELTPAQQANLAHVLEELNRNGFEVDTFGGATIVIKSVPIVASKCDVKLLTTEIIDALENEEYIVGIKQAQEKIAASIACRAAIKINNPLTLEKMQWLLDALMIAKVSTHCPHGRPIVLRLGLREIEKNFKRI